MIHKSILFLFVTVYCLSLIVCPRSVLAQTVDAKPAEPKNVLDYYLLLPQEELPVLEVTKKPRQALIKVQDVANGFLALGDDDLQGITQIALFRKKDRSPLIGVAQTEQAVASSGGVKFLQYQDGKWNDVTAEVLPKVADKEILGAYNRIKKGEDEERTLQHLPAVYWELPKKGTTVEMRCGEDSDSKDKVLMRFEWDGTRFTKKTL